MPIWIIKRLKEKDKSQPDKGKEKLRPDQRKDQASSAWHIEAGEETTARPQAEKGQSLSLEKAVPENLEFLKRRNDRGVR